MAAVDNTVTVSDHPMPIVDERNPGIGRRSRVLEQQRQSSGGLEDGSEENPVRDDEPFRVTHSDSNDGTGRR